MTNEPKETGDQRDTKKARGKVRHVGCLVASVGMSNLGEAMESKTETESLTYISGKPHKDYVQRHWHVQRFNWAEAQEMANARGSKKGL